MGYVGRSGTRMQPQCTQGHPNVRNDRRHSSAGWLVGESLLTTEPPAALATCLLSPSLPPSMDTAASLSDCWAPVQQSRRTQSHICEGRAEVRKEKRAEGLIYPRRPMSTGNQITKQLHFHL